MTTLKRRPACIVGKEWFAFSAAVSTLYDVMRRNRAKGLVTWEQTAPNGGYGPDEFALAATKLSDADRALIFEAV